MKILINGICGHMGREVLALCEAGYRGAECICGVDPFATGNEQENPSQYATRFHEVWHGVKANTRKGNDDDGRGG